MTFEIIITPFVFNWAVFALGFIAGIVITLIDFRKKIFRKE